MRLKLSLTLVVLAVIAGCDNGSEAPEDPEILGFPPDTAFLGVDYSHNFGASGGDELLNFSLANNPTWLSLEETTNKARPGIVLRGQPGITGGRRGEDDLGVNENIRVVANDGNLLGGREFEIQVQHNALSIIAAPMIEGQANTPEVSKDDNAVCDIPDMDVTRRVEVRHRNLVTGSDVFSEQFENEPATRTYTTYPSLIRVDLEQPSVEEVSVRFRVGQSDPFAEVGNDEDSCEINNDLPCEFQGSNRSKTIFGDDLLLNGNAARYQTDRPFPEPPEYIEFIEETGEEGRGVLTFEPGQTTCFIPVWVHDDDLPERNERFELDLEAVTEGLATLDGSGANDSEDIVIEDPNPVASIERSDIVVTRGADEPLALKAMLDRPNGTGEILRAGIEWSSNDEEGVVQDVAACFPEPTDCTDTPPLAVSFEPAADEARFYLKVNASGANEQPDPLRPDQVFELSPDEDFQFGREFGAVAAEETSEVSVNEWRTDANAGIPLQSIIPGAIGELYLAGTTGDQPELISINRLGEVGAGNAPDAVDFTAGRSFPAVNGRPLLDFADNNAGTSGSTNLRRFIGLGYTSGAGDDATGSLVLFRSGLESDQDQDGVDCPATSDRCRTQPASDLLWQYQTGDADLGSFLLEGLSVSSRGNLTFAGTAAQPDPLRLVRVENNTDGDTPSPMLAWSLSEQTEGANNVIGFGQTGFGGGNVIGTTLGAVNSDTAVGMEDFFIAGTQNGDALDTRRQFGSDETDSLSAVSGGGNSIWLGGDGNVLYELNEQGDALEPDSPLEEGNAFILVASSTGNVRGVRNFANAQATPVPSSVDAIDDLGSTAIAAGRSANQGPYLMSLRLDSGAANEGETIAVDWRIEVAGAEKVVDVSVFDDRKVFVAYESGGSSFIRLYDLEGTRLTD